MAKSKVTSFSAAACDQVTLRVTNKWIHPWQNDGKTSDCCFLLAVSFSFKCYKSRQEMCQFNTKIIIVQLLRLLIVSAKSEIHSPRRIYLSPGSSMV